jgi:hypothetical protein
MVKKKNSIFPAALLKALAISSLFALAIPNHGAKKSIKKPESPIARGKDGKVLSIDGKPYKLVWNDEFSGAELDKNKWAQRILGYGYAGQYSTEKCAYVDGKGHLVLAMCAYSKSKLLQKLKEQKQREIAKTPFRGQKRQIKKLTKQIERLFINKKNYIPATSHLKTGVNFLYGYHEIRFKLPNIPGPGLTFWFPAGKKARASQKSIFLKDVCIIKEKNSVITNHQRFIGIRRIRKGPPRTMAIAGVFSWSVDILLKYLTILCKT